MNEVRLINANELKETINAFYDAYFVGCFSSALITFAKGVDEMIDNAPTAEQPTGEWEIVDAEGGKIWNCVCTECGHDPQEYIGGTEDWWIRKPHLPNFCPNCGVRMINVKGGAE